MSGVQREHGVQAERPGAGAVAGGPQQVEREVTVEVQAVAAASHPPRATGRTSRPSREREGVMRGAIARAMASTFMAAP